MTLVRPSITFGIPGVPISPNRSRWAREDPRFTEWREKAARYANGARNTAHWRNDGEPAPRWVRIVLRRRRLLDPDHAVTSITPVLNGMKIGNALLFDDTDGTHGGLCHLVGVEQVQIPMNDEERTVITVWLVPPE